jgi:parallel beta-helix repeat protein
VKASKVVFLVFLIILSLCVVNTRSVKSQSSGTIYIRADGSVDPATTSIQRIGNIYSFTDDITDSIMVEKDNIVIDGAGYDLYGAGSGNGIELRGRSNVTIRNILISGFYCCIYFYNSSKNTISGNGIRSSHVGIWLAPELPSNENIIRGNNVIGNEIGILINNCTGNIVYENTIEQNRFVGLSFYLGSNTIYRNNIIDNNRQVALYTLENTWDINEKGNYWSDYAGNDTNHDGIGDSPYPIPIELIFPEVETIYDYDRYPLMNPWDSPSYNLTIHSSPTGVTFIADGVPLTTPWSGIYSKGASVGLVLPETYDGYVWSHWLEDGDPNRTKAVTMDKNITLTALFALDTTPPNISVISPENTMYNVNNVSLVFTVSERTSWIGYGLDAQANVTIVGNTTLTGLSEGKHRLTIYANDTAGNMGTSETIYFSINTEPFPTTVVIAASVASVAIICIGLLFYFKKRKHKAEITNMVKQNNFQHDFLSNFYNSQKHNS